MNEHMQRWNTLRKRRAVATAYLLERDGTDRAAAVCDVMFHLNRRARGSRNGFTTLVYQLKNDLVHHLYRAGYCTALSRDVQELKCWCGGDSWCEKCEGTGVYRENVLYRFAFTVGSQRYIWHQPDDLVTWPVELTGHEMRDYETRDEERPAWPMPDLSPDVSAQIVNVYLNWYGLGKTYPSLTVVLRRIVKEKSIVIRRRLALFIFPEFENEIPF